MKVVNHLNEVKEDISELHIGASKITSPISLKIIDKKDSFEIEFTDERGGKSTVTISH